MLEGRERPDPGALELMEDWTTEKRYQTFSHHSNTPGMFEIKVFQQRPPCFDSKSRDLIFLIKYLRYSFDFKNLIRNSGNKRFNP